MRLSKLERIYKRKLFRCLGIKGKAKQKAWMVAVRAKGICCTYRELYTVTMKTTDLLQTMIPAIEQTIRDIVDSISGIAESFSDVCVGGGE